MPYISTCSTHHWRCGWANGLHYYKLVRGTAEYGHAFEHLIIQELRAWLIYTESREKLSYWRTHTGLEVDAVIGDARIGIEIKSVEEVLPRHLKGLKAFSEDYPEARTIIVSLDPFNRRIGNIECLYILDFLKMLWGTWKVSQWANAPLCFGICTALRFKMQAAALANADSCIGDWRQLHWQMQLAALAVADNSLLCNKRNTDIV